MNIKHTISTNNVQALMWHGDHTISLRRLALLEAL